MYHVLIRSSTPVPSSVSDCHHTSRDPSTLPCPLLEPGPRPTWSFCEDPSAWQLSPPTRCLPAILCRLASRPPRPGTPTAAIELHTQNNMRSTQTQPWHALNMQESVCVCLHLSLKNQSSSPIPDHACAVCPSHTLPMPCYVQLPADIFL